MTTEINATTIAPVEPKAETTKRTTKPAPKGKAKAKAAAKPKARGAVIVADDPKTSPTALARQMITHNATDDSIMEKTKAAFGPESKSPKLFTRSDLGRLRLRIKRAATQAAHKAAKEAKTEK